MTRYLVAAGLTAFTCLYAHSAMAEEAPSSNSASAAAPDIVRLKNGGMLRGAISEIVPGGSVVIVTLTGETRTIPMSDVSYAGPRKDDAVPVAAKPAEAAKDSVESKVPVEFIAQGDDKHLTLKVQTASTAGVFGTNAFAADTYMQLCSAPCETQLAPARYKFAIADAHGNSIIVANPVQIDGPTKLYGRVESQEITRQVGWGIALGSLATGIAVAAGAFGGEKSMGGSENTMYIGLGLGGLGTLVGALIGLLVEDDASISSSSY